jgi:hypothetical protein
MACIDAKDIPRSLLPAGASPKKEIKALGTLKAFGFIRERINGASYDMHRLVHIAMRNLLKLKDKWGTWKQASLRRVLDIFPWPQNENRAVWTMYLPHAHTIATFNWEISRLEETKELLGRLLFNLGECFRIKGQYAEAEVMDRQTLQLKKTVLGKEHLDTLISRNNLINSLRQPGRNTEAEAMH